MRELILNSTQLNALNEEMCVHAQSICLRGTVTGSCMLPFIRHGDALTIATATPHSMRIGDVAVYQSSGNSMIAHRLVSKRVKQNQIQFITRGDASFWGKEEVRKSQLIGRVVTVHRNGQQFNINAPFYRMAALIWIMSSPVAPFILHLARKGFSFSKSNLIKFLNIIN